jgi:hypothetical protein
MPGQIRGRISRAYDQLVKSQSMEEANRQPLVSGDILNFCNNMIHWKPYPYQEKLLLDNTKFIAARMARQTGKSTTLAVLALYTALAKPNANVVIVGPSLRQARLLVQKAWILARNIRRVFRSRPLKGRLEFRNGSIIQALPNSPETIRGLTSRRIQFRR